MKSKTLLKKGIISIAMIAAIAAVAILAGCSRDGASYQRNNEGRRGRQTEELGEPATITGTLAYGDPEWYLNADKGSILLGLGNRAYLESTALDLEDGKTATATGYVVDDEMTVTRMSVDGGPSVALRDEDGAPLWARRTRNVT